MGQRAALAGIALLFLGGILLALAWREPERMSSAESKISARAVENGASRYRDYCAGCHGVAGLGIPGLAPALNTPDLFTRRLTDIGYTGSLRSYVESTVATGRPVSHVAYASTMPAWSNKYGGALRDDEISDIASFVLNWDPAAHAAGDLASTPTIAGTSSAVEKGKAVFYGPAGCLGCHGQPGQGGLSGPDLAGIARRAAGQVPGLSAEQAIRQSILAPGAMIASGCLSETCPDIMPRDYGNRLRQADLDALIRYLLTLEEGGPVPPATPPPRGDPAPVDEAIPTVTPVPTLRPARGDPHQGKVLYDQECLPCHGDRGQGRSASSLAAVFASIDPYQYVRAVVEQGVPGTTMPAWGAQAGGRLSEEQIDHIAAYVTSWDGVQPLLPSQNPATITPDRPATLAAAIVLAILAVGGPALLLFLQRRAKRD